MGYVRPAKPQNNLRKENILGVLRYCLDIICKFLSLKGGCGYSSESTLIKMPHCWISHVAAIVGYHMSRLISELVTCEISIFQLVFVTEQARF